MYSVAYTGFVKLVGWKTEQMKPNLHSACVPVCPGSLVFYLVWVQSEICIQQLPGVVVRLALVDLVGGVSDLYIHGPVGHPLVLEALGPTPDIEAAVTP